MSQASFAVSAGAARAIRCLVADRAPTLATGMRITRTDTPPRSLLLSLASRPHANDHVFSSDGAKLFIASDVVASLANKVVDVEINQQGVAIFCLIDQANPATRGHRLSEGLN